MLEVLDKSVDVVLILKLLGIEEPHALLQLSRNRSLCKYGHHPNQGRRRKLKMYVSCHIILFYYKCKDSQFLL